MVVTEFFRFAVLGKLAPSQDPKPLPPKAPKTAVAASHGQQQSATPTPPRQTEADVERARMASEHARTVTLLEQERVRQATAAQQLAAAQQAELQARADQARVERELRLLRTSRA